MRGDTRGPADLDLTGEAAWLYAALWNRLPLTGDGDGDGIIAGDRRLARLWSETSPVA